VGSTHHLEMVFVWKQNYILVDEYFFFCCTWIVNSALFHLVSDCHVIRKTKINVLIHPMEYRHNKAGNFLIFTP
ncbi:hypothetical protein, partial [Escherichia coli]|uniref:hypothetical protein n=1 Tax=Escherichia coli TaxID=562 RepID=UPI001BC8AFB5